jgi:hypothetical protein
VATTTQLAIPVRAASPIALWHLFSLDAPTVAALWTWFIARSSHIRLPLASPAAMALAVWILYAADRLLDAARPGAADSEDLEARHLFHRRHRRAFLTGIVFAAAALALLLPTLDPAAIRLYLIEGVLLIAWFVILHTMHSAHRLPKEIAVGLFFSAATFIPTIARAPALRPSLLPAAILFAAICSLNCFFIYAWEHDPSSQTPHRPAHATTRIATAHLPVLTALLATAATALALFGAAGTSPIAAACALAAALLFALHRNRRRLARIDLRAAADLALLTPLLLLPFLR